jgi:hypothetical protein
MCSMWPARLMWWPMLSPGHLSTLNPAQAFLRRKRVAGNPHHQTGTSVTGLYSGGDRNCGLPASAATGAGLPAHGC